MIEWKKSIEAMPEDGQECLIYSSEEDGLAGPIVYKVNMGGWLEAGACYRPAPGGPVTHWAPWNGPPEEK